MAVQRNFCSCARAPLADRLSLGRITITQNKLTLMFADFLFKIYFDVFFTVASLLMYALTISAAHPMSFAHFVKPKKKCHSLLPQIQVT